MDDFFYLRRYCLVVLQGAFIIVSILFFFEILGDFSVLQKITVYFVYFMSFV